MNIGMTLTCGTCDCDTDCRIGFSNRPVQPLQLACPHCHSLMKITLHTRGVPGPGIHFDNAKELKERQYPAPFDGRNPFFDLHLDFPVHHGPYVPGSTPFLMAVQSIPHDQENSRLSGITSFAGRMNGLNATSLQSEDICRTIRLYSGSNKQLFKQRASKFLGHDFGPSMSPGVLDDVLYSLLFRVSSPLIDVQADEVWTEEVKVKLEQMGQEQQGPFDELLSHLHETYFLENLRRDCVRLYIPILSAEISLRPAIFLDLIGSTEDSITSGRVSSKDFVTYKDLYKDMSEVYSRQLVLAAALNNLAERNSFNSFPTNEQGAALASLDAFANKTLSEKFKYLKDGWIPCSRDAVDPHVRNAIAHNAVQYNEASQVISYYPHKEGVRQDQEEQISYLEFMRKMLIMFREINALHQLVWLVGHHIYDWQHRNKRNAPKRS